MKKNTFIILGFITGIIFILSKNSHAQEILYQENFGNPTSNTLIQNYTGWQNNEVLYTGNGTCDIRSSNASSGYGLASGGGNVMINDTVKWFQLSGLSTLSQSDISLYCGIRKTTTENGSNLVVEVSADSIVWTRLYLEDTLPTGTGTSGWYRVRYLGVPTYENLHIKFSNTSASDYRIDDIALVVGEEVTLETVATPSFSPSGGTYYEPQDVTIHTTTDGASIFFTMDGSLPTSLSNAYTGPIAISTSTSIKAIASKNGMYDSEIITANYVIIDTNSLVELPFDLSGNSEHEHLDITSLPGFRAYHLGDSYSDGSAKFETAHAGQASLIAHLDSAPDSLFFGIRGRKGGSNPSDYTGISFEISQSPNGQTWNPLLLLSEQNIDIDNYSSIGLKLSHDARFLRWKLLSADKGNTQLNNIRITKSHGGADSTGIAAHSTSTFSIYPNPTSDILHLQNAESTISSIMLLDLCGNILSSWGHGTTTINLSSYPKGTYILIISTPSGKIIRKIVKI